MKQQRNHHYTLLPLAQNLHEATSCAKPAVHTPRSRGYLSKHNQFINPTTRLKLPDHTRKICASDYCIASTLAAIT